LYNWKEICYTTLSLFWTRTELASSKPELSTGWQAVLLASFLARSAAAFAATAVPNLLEKSPAIIDSSGQL
jgi:hypothetical protein